MNEVQVYAEYSIPCQCYNLYIVKDGRRAELVFEERKMNEFAAPTLQLSSRSNEAQALMDRLWSCGLRPTEGNGSAGALAATERHLADLKALVEKAYKVKLP